METKKELVWRKSQWRDGRGGGDHQVDGGVQVHDPEAEWLV